MSCSTVSCSTVTCSTTFQRMRNITEKDHENSIPKRIRKKWEKQEELHEDSLPAFHVITGERCGRYHSERCGGHHGKHYGGPHGERCGGHHGERCGGHHVECCGGYHSPAVVKDGNGVILAIRIDLPSTLIDTLRSTHSLLPRRGGGSTKRGQYSTRHYALWCDYSRNPFMSKELLDDGDQAQAWLARNSQLFQFLTKRPICMHCCLPQCSL